MKLPSGLASTESGHGRCGMSIYEAAMPTLQLLEREREDAQAALDAAGEAWLEARTHGHSTERAEAEAQEAAARLKRAEADFRSETNRRKGR